MKILLIFTLCLISDGGASKEVTGYSGGGILIKCKYDTEYTQNAKYFCKVSWAACSEQIKTGDKNQWVNSGRFSLFDDTRSAEFWVMIRELTVQDTGTYHCGVYRDLLIAIKTPVKLKVKKGSLVSRDVTAYAGTRSNIKCKYEDEYKDKPKSFYKIEETDQWSFNQIRTKTNSEWSHKGRFSIHDNRSAGFFSVFIRELNMEDTGTYACVVVTEETEIYTIVKINVTEGLSYEKSISEIVHIGQDLTVSCNYPESHRNDNKFFCKRTATAACSYALTVKESRKNVKKGHLSLYDDREKQILTVSLRNMAEKDAGEYWCGAEVNWKSDHGYKVYFTRINLEVTGFPVVVIVLAILLPLLCIISSLGVILYKRYKRQGQATTAQIYRESNSEVENEPEAVYDSANVNVYQFDPVYENLSF